MTADAVVAAVAVAVAVAVGTKGDASELPYRPAQRSWVLVQDWLSRVSLYQDWAVAFLPARRARRRRRLGDLGARGGAGKDCKEPAC